jgi:hypothetical protein
MRLCSHSKCSYPVFGTDKNTRLGYCKSHQYLRTDLDRRSITQKGMEKARVKKEASQIDEEAERAEALEKFFEDAARELSLKPHCQECGDFIPEKYYRHATAHILPKKLFKSVQSHPMNKLFLGAGCGCHNKTHTWSKFVKMNVWHEAVRRFVMFEPEIALDERKYLPDCLLIEFRKINPEPQHFLNEDAGEEE